MSLEVVLINWTISKNFRREEIFRLRKDFRRQTLLSYVNLSKEDISYKQNRAPCLIKDSRISSKNMSISFSHSGSRDVMVVSSDPFVGIDLEFYSDRRQKTFQTNKFKIRFQNFLHDSSLDKTNIQSPPRYTFEYLELWTMLEAEKKFHQRGLFESTKNFNSPFLYNFWLEDSHLSIASCQIKEKNFINFRVYTHEL